MKKNQAVYWDVSRAVYRWTLVDNAVYRAVYDTVRGPHHPSLDAFLADLQAKKAL